MLFKNKKDREHWQLLANAWVMGLHLVSGTVVGLVMGYYLDKWLGTKPWLIIIFLILGIIAGFRNMYREAKKIHDHDTGAGKSA